MIGIAMIPRTNEPMEGEVFDVQDHTRRRGTRWTGTHGEMISSDLHGAEEPIRWLLGPHQGQRQDSDWSILCTREEEGHFHPRHLGWAQPLGVDPLQVERVLYDAPGCHLGAMTSPPVSGTLTEQFATCGRAWRPNEGQRLSSSAEICPKKGQCLPQRG